jgi:hypothetical protein
MANRKLTAMVQNGTTRLAPEGANDARRHIKLFLNDIKIFWSNDQWKIFPDGKQVMSLPIVN